MKRIYYAIIIALVMNFISNAQIKTIEYLASKDLQGRLPGSEGFTKACNFMAGEYAKLKLIPGGDDGYFQKFKMEYNQILAPEHFSVIKNEKKKDYQLGPDYVYRGFTGGGKIKAPVVFCGYGISQPDSGYDDYAGVDVKDKVVMVFKYNPKWKSFPNGNPREKSIVAIKHGAVGILLVSFPNDAEPQKPIGSVLHGEGEQPVNFPQLHIELYVADDLFNGSGYSIKELQTKIDDSRKPFSIPLKNKVDLEVHTKYEKEKEVQNVVGIIEGSDPVLKNEFVIIGGHLDHVGGQAGKIYFPGANDNASGSATVLEIARNFIASKAKPKRSIIFIMFAGEEQGLNGSTYFADHIKNVKNVKAMINMDCVGCGDSIRVGGGKSSPDLWNLVNDIDSKNDNMLVANTGGGGGADAEPFFKKGIPTLYFVSTNSYKYLHQLGDKPETLNVKLLESMTKLGFKTTLAIANQ